MNMHVPSLQRRISDVIAEYDEKSERIVLALQEFEAAGNALKMAATIGGTWGQTNIETGRVYERCLRESLLKSAWRHVYSGLNIDRLASADDKRRFDMAMQNPPDFTLENVRATFGHFIEDPRGNILRGLAEVFCQLDPFYKSHDRVKIGVKGLPKRIILSNVGWYSSYGMDKLRDVLNALAAYQGKPLVEYEDFKPLEKFHMIGTHSAGTCEIRGLTIKKFANGNAHVMFDEVTLLDINRALAEFYGDVLPDTPDEKPDKRQESTAVAKDLQFYPTPAKVIERVLGEFDYRLAGEVVLEPSCGDGAFLDALKAKGAIVVGIEVNPERVAICRAKGHSVMPANFLQVTPVPKYDRVVMNPPFYGKHYAKHVRHAVKFLKPEGTLVAILPITARYDHGLLDDLNGSWNDLPVGSFAESGTNINTTVLTVRRDRIVTV